MEHFDKLCLAPDGSLALRPAWEDKQEAYEELAKSRRKHFEVLTLLTEAEGLVEALHQAIDGSTLGASSNAAPLALKSFGLQSDVEVYEELESRLAAAEASQRLRLPLLDEAGPLPPPPPLPSAPPEAAPERDAAAPAPTARGLEEEEPQESDGASALLLGGSEEHVLGLLAPLLAPALMEHGRADPSGAYRRSLVPEVEERLHQKLARLARLWHADAAGEGRAADASELAQEVDRAAAALEAEERQLDGDFQEVNKQLLEHYHLLERVLGVLLQLSQEHKLKRRLQYDEMKEQWLTSHSEALQSKLKVLEQQVLHDTYNATTLPALTIIRARLCNKLEEETRAYNSMVAKLQQFQRVDPHFNELASMYRNYVAKLKHIEWTIKEVEEDLK